MRFTQETGRLVSKKKLAPGIFDYTVAVPRVAGAASCGQFVNVLCGGCTLRRPISIAGFDREAGTLRLVFEIRGKGTGWLSGLREGDPVDLTGPLGHGFPLLDAGKRAVMVGGGIGTPPLLPLARHYGENAAVVSGFRTASAVILQEDYRAAGAETILCTDDGTAGMHGFTTQALERCLDSRSFDVVYTCGPKPMMRGVARLAEERGILCYVSMEERMGCGVGACLCCATPTRDKQGEHMTRVCLNGPVFASTEVMWDGR